MSESITSLRDILAKSARSDATIQEKGEEKTKLNRVELQYPKIMVLMPKSGACAGVKKGEGRTKTKEEGKAEADERVVERKKSGETISLGSESGEDGGSIFSL